MNLLAKLSSVFITIFIVAPGMQRLIESEAQSTCDRLLDMDERLMYTGYLNSSGSTMAEAMRNSVSNYDRLTVMVLPLSSRRDSLVLASIVGSDLISIVENVKKFLHSGSSIPLFLKA